MHIIREHYLVQETKNNVKTFKIFPWYLQNQHLNDILLFTSGAYKITHFISESLLCRSSTGESSGLETHAPYKRALPHVPPSFSTTGWMFKSIKWNLERKNNSKFINLEQLLRSHSHTQRIAGNADVQNNNSLITYYRQKVSRPDN